MNSDENINPKQSESRKFLAQFDFKPKKVFRETISLITDSYTYNIKYNPFLWFGSVIGLPVPVYLLYYDFTFLKDSWLTTSSIVISIGHLVGMTFLFGALGTLYWNHHANLQHQATHDELTNLLTHGTFHNLAKRRIEEARRYDKIIGLIMLDLDHFKKINDTYGHKKGDEVLVTVSNYLDSATRSTDIVARYGGEEFAVLLPETSLNESYQTAERIRELIDGDDEKLPELLTVSGGVGSYPLSGNSLEDLIKIVDECLYYAKENGRNCIKTVHELPQSRKPARRHITLKDMNTGVKIS